MTDQPTPFADEGQPAEDAQVITAEVVSAEGISSPPAKPRPGLWLAMGLAVVPLLAQFALGMLVAIVVAVVVVARGQDLRADFPTIMASAEGLLFAMATLSTMVVAWFMARLLYGSSALRCLGWRACTRSQAVAAVLFCLPLAVLCSEATNLVVDLLTQVAPKWTELWRQQQAQSLGSFARQPYLLVLLAGCLFPGVGEEILCRGVIGRGLIARHGIVIGALLASLLFGVMHLEPVQAFGAFLMGLALQYVFLTSRSLPVAILVHALNNALAFTLLRFEDQLVLRGLSSLPDAGGTHVPLLLLGVSAMAMAATTLLLYRLRTTWVLPDGEPWTPGYVSGEQPPGESGATSVTGSAPVTLWLVTGLLTAGVIGAAIWSVN